MNFKLFLLVVSYAAALIAFNFVVAAEEADPNDLTEELKSSIKAKIEEAKLVDTNDGKIHKTVNKNVQLTFWDWEVLSFKLSKGETKFAAATSNFTSQHIFLKAKIHFDVKNAPVINTAKGEVTATLKTFSLACTAKGEGESAIITSVDTCTAKNDSADALSLEWKADSFFKNLALKMAAAKYKQDVTKLMEDVLGKVAPLFLTEHKDKVNKLLST